MKLKNIPCKECKIFSGDYDDLMEICGFHLVYCEDGKMRSVDIEEGCSEKPIDIY